MNRYAVTLAATVLATVAGGPAQASFAGVHADEPSQQGRLLLMLDASGSMNKPDPSGVTKIEAAKRALTGVVGSLPANATVGLRVYGATQPGGKPTPAACRDTQLVHPIGPLDRTGLTRAITGFSARGETPIAYSLEQALRDLGPSGKRNLVLVSDGEESCVPDPCPAFKKLIGNGVDIQLDTVGFGVDAKARQQLQCLADAGHGSYYDARDAGALSLSLGKLSQRAQRPFSVSGTPVRGTVDQAQAPTISAGQYVDTIGVKQAPVFYKVTRRAGSAVTVTVTARPLATRQDWATERFNLTLFTPEGEQCAFESVYRFEASVYFSKVLSGGVRQSGPEGVDADTNRCESSHELILRVERPEGERPLVPVELVVTEERAIVDRESLPEPVKLPEPSLAPVTGSPRAVTGGGSFNDATTLTSGTYSESVMSGEQLFYKVRLDYGQRAVLTVDTPMPGHIRRRDTTIFVDVEAFTPSRVPIPYSGNAPQTRTAVGRYTSMHVLGTHTPVVMARNDEASVPDGGVPGHGRRAATLAGYYYFSLAAAGWHVHPDGGPLPVRLRVAVVGTPSAAPTFADVSTPSLAASESPTAQPTGTGSPSGSSSQSAAPTPSLTPRASGGMVDEGPPWLPIGLGAGGLVVLAAAAFGFTRSRRGRTG